MKQTVQQNTRGFEADFTWFGSVCHWTQEEGPRGLVRDEKAQLHQDFGSGLVGEGLLKRRLQQKRWLKNVQQDIAGVSTKDFNQDFLSGAVCQVQEPLWYS